MIDTIFLFAVAHFLLFVGLGYVAPASHVRKFLLLLIIACCLVSVRSPVAAWFPANIGHDYVIGFIFHASHYLCLARLAPSPKSTSSQKRAWSFNQLFEARWGIAYIPPFKEGSPEYVPSRSTLFISRLWDFTWTSGLIWFIILFPLNTDPVDFSGVPNGYLHRISEMQPREIVIRHYLFFSGIGSAYLVLRAAHSLITCIALAFGDSPKGWPPLFGSLGDAYTVRRWYS